MKKGQGQKLAAASAAMLIAEPVSLALHAGGVGVIAGLAAGAIAYLAVDEVHQHQAKGESEQVEEPIAPAKKRPVGSGKPPLAYRLIAGKSVRGESATTSSTPEGLPRRSPTFAEMKHLIKPGRVILGFDGQKFISGEVFSQVVNIAIIGLPRHGKSTALRFHMAQGLIHNAIIRGWDVHGDVAGEFADYLSIAESVATILADCAWIDQELERRAELFKRYRKHDPQAEREWSRTRPLLYIIDEFLLLMTVHLKKQTERDTVANTLLNLIAGASKYKVRVVLSGQSLPADVFGEQASSVRDIIDTKCAFASGDRQARMVGIDEKAIKEQLPLIAGDDIRGYSIIAGGPLVANKIASIPDTTFQDIAALLPERDEADQYEDDQYEGEEDLPEGITEWDLEQIVQAHQAGWQLRDIAALLQMDLPLFKVACELVGITIGTASARPRSPMDALPDTDPVSGHPPLKIVPKPLAAKPRRADYNDAVKVWNEIGEDIGRPRLQKALQDRGFECSDDLAKQLLVQIKDALKKQAVDAGGGGGVGAVGE